MACCSACARTGGSCGGGHRHAPAFPATLGAVDAVLLSAFGAEPMPLGGYCGERFAQRVSASGGRTASKPCDPPFMHTLMHITCNPGDAQAWFVSGKNLFADVRSAWNQLIAGENEIQDWTESRKIREYITTYETQWQALASAWPWTFRTEYSGEVDAFKTNMKRGACALQLLDEASQAVRKKGGNVAPVPEPHGTDESQQSMWPLIVIGVVLLLAGGAGGFAGRGELQRRGIL